MRTKHSYDLALLHVTHCNSCNCWEQKYGNSFIYRSVSAIFLPKQQVYTPARLVRITPFGKIKTFFLSVISCLSLQPIKSAYKSGVPNQFFSTAVSASQKSLFCRVKQCLLHAKTGSFEIQYNLGVCQIHSCWGSRQPPTAIYFVCITPSSNKFCCIKYRVSSSFPMIPTKWRAVTIVF